MLSGLSNNSFKATNGCLYMDSKSIKGVLAEDFFARLCFRRMGLDPNEAMPLASSIGESMGESALLYTGEMGSIMISKISLFASTSFAITVDTLSDAEEEGRRFKPFAKKPGLMELFAALLGSDASAC